MADIMNNNVETGKTEPTNTTPVATEVIVQEGKGKKILKWIGTGIGVIATFIAGVFVGKGMNGNDDGDSATESTND